MNKKWKIGLVLAAVVGLAIYAIAQSIQANGGPASGISGTMVGGSDYATTPLFHFFATDGSGRLITTGVTTGAADPCASPAISKSSVPINISAAATSALVSVSGTTTVYVCGFSMSISQVVTTANTIQFGYSTVAACASGVTALTGLYGAGGVTAASPITVSQGGAGTIFKTPASNGLCVTTAIGATGNFAGVVSYVQQ